MSGDVVVVLCLACLVLGGWIRTRFHAVPRGREFRCPKCGNQAVALSNPEFLHAFTKGGADCDAAAVCPSCGHEWTQEVRLVPNEGVRVLRD